MMTEIKKDDTDKLNKHNSELPAVEGSKADKLASNTLSNVNESIAPTPVEVVRDVVVNHPEMSWLTGGTNATPESSFDSDGNNTVAEQLFPSLDKGDLVEFNRTAVGILLLSYILEGDYDKFTACQKEGVKLSPQSFQQLRNYTKQILPNKEAHEAMVTYMVINDLTKVKKVVAKITDTMKVEDVDHDKLLRIALERNPEISPSYQALYPKYQKLILNGLKADFNIGQFIQGESVPANLTGLKGIDADSLDFYLLHALCDIAGAAGQFIQNGSVVMTQPTYDGFNYSISALEGLAEGESEKAVYDEYLKSKAQGLELDITDPEQRAVARICCMLRFSNAEQSQAVTDVLDDLPQNTKAILVEELNRNGVDDGFATLLYYSPALLANIQKGMEADNSPENFKQGLSLGLTTLARVYQEARIQLNEREGSGVYTVIVSDLANAANEDPKSITGYEISLNPVGDDAKVVKKNSQ